ECRRSVQALRRADVAARVAEGDVERRARLHTPTAPRLLGGVSSAKIQLRVPDATGHRVRRCASSRAESAAVLLGGSPAVEAVAGESRSHGAGTPRCTA